MKIKFRPYRKKDGTIMLYVNNDRGVSTGISQESGTRAAFSQGSKRHWGKTTAGERKLLSAMRQALTTMPDVRQNTAADKTAVPDFNAHSEDKARLDIGDLYLTDTATVGGVQTGSDGAFLVTKTNKIIALSETYEVVK